jgi:hypothetical protein
MADLAALEKAAKDAAEKARACGRDLSVARQAAYVAKTSAARMEVALKTAKKNMENTGKKATDGRMAIVKNAHVEEALYNDVPEMEAAAKDAAQNAAAKAAALKEAETKWAAAKEAKKKAAAAFEAAKR